MKEIKITSSYASDNEANNTKVYLAGYYAGYEMGHEIHYEPFDDGVMTECIEVTVPQICFHATDEDIEQDWRHQYFEMMDVL